MLGGDITGRRVLWCSGWSPGVSECTSGLKILAGRTQAIVHLREAAANPQTTLVHRSQKANRDQPGAGLQEFTQPG